MVGILGPRGGNCGLQVYLRFRRILAMYAFAAAEPFTNRAGRFFVPLREEEARFEVLRLAVDFEEVRRVAERLRVPPEGRHTFCAAGVC